MPSPWVDRHQATLHTVIQSHLGREHAALAILNHYYRHVIAINAVESVLFEIHTCPCDIAEHHQRLALRANSPPNSGGPDQCLVV